MNKRIILKAVCFVLIAATALSLASCGGSEESTDTPIWFDPVESTPAETETGMPENNVKFDIGDTDAVKYFKHEPVDGDYAVNSAGYTVTHGVFDVLFNLVLYHQITPSDGYFDIYDEYFTSGELDREGSIKSQKTPKGVYWYADTRSSALFICFEAIRCLAFAEEKGFYAFTPEHVEKINEEAEKIKRGDYGFTSGDLLVPDTDDTVLLAALSLFTLYDDQATYEEIRGFAGFDTDKFEIDNKLSPGVSSAFAK